MGFFSYQRYLYCYLVEHILVPHLFLYLPLLFCIGTLTIYLVLGVRSWNSMFLFHFRSCFSHHIYTSIFKFISTSFRSCKRDTMPCFLGTTIAHRISTSCSRLDSYSTICSFIHKAIHTWCILINLHYPPYKGF